MPLTRSFRTRKRPSVDVSALADISFLLVLFMAISLTRFRDYEEEYVELPKSQQLEYMCGMGQGVTLVIDQNGELSLDVELGEERDKAFAEAWEYTYPEEPQLTDFVAKLREHRPRDQYNIKADANTSYAMIAEVVSTLQDHDINQFSFWTVGEGHDPDIPVYKPRRRIAVF